MIEPDRSYRGRRRLLDLLKQEGPLEAAALGRRLGVTATAVRQHLKEMEAEGLVAAEPQARPVGRPVRLWRLTPAADRFFPDGHAELAVELLGALESAFGPAGTERLIAARTARQLAAYRAQVPQDWPLRRKLEALAALRSAEGYMAELQPEAEGEGGAGYLLIENHCPICTAARACSGLCAGELQLFQVILGPGVRIERLDHLLAGARRCAYRVTAAAGSGERET